MMEKFNSGKPFTSFSTGKIYTGLHGRDSNNKFALCPYGKSNSLPFCDGCGHHTKTKTEIKPL